MKKILLKGDRTLNTLLIINFLNLVFIIIGQETNKIRYIFALVDFLVLFFCDEKKMLPILFFIHPNSALYDGIGFPYLFNFSVVIVAIRLIIKNKIDKETIIIFLLICCWEIILILKAGILDKSLLPIVSWISSYIVLIILSKKPKENFETIYTYFLLGFISAFLYGAAIPIKKWGIQNIPTAYRFIGLLRDPNYYSMDALLLIFSAGNYAKIKNKTQILYIFIVFAMGICSVSKMFIALFVVGCIFKLLFEFKEIKPIQLIMGILIISIIGYCLKKIGVIDIFIKKYLYRSETTSLFTGRDYLFSYYFNAIFSSVKNVLFGNSALKYSSILSAGTENTYFTNFVAHNTYLDILLAWGVLGTIVYILLIKKILQNAKNANISSYKFTSASFKETIIVFIIGLCTLSFLTTDVFALIILYLISLRYSIRNVEE